MRFKVSIARIWDRAPVLEYVMPEVQHYTAPMGPLNTIGVDTTYPKMYYSKACISQMSDPEAVGDNREMCIYATRELTGNQQNC